MILILMGGVKSWETSTHCQDSSETTDDSTENSDMPDSTNVADNKGNKYGLAS